MHDAISFIESIERMRGSGLALAPTAMAGMNNQRRSDQTISNLSARASAFHVRLRRGGIALSCRISLRAPLGSANSAKGSANRAGPDLTRHMVSPVIDV